MKPLHPDDPKLTAYILGELDGRAAEKIEASIAGDVDASVREAIEETLDIASIVEAAFAKEPELFLTSEQRTAILRGQVPDRHFERALPFRVETFPVEEVARAVVASGLGGGGRGRRPGRTVGRMMRWAAVACLAVGSAGLLVVGVLKSGAGLGIAWSSGGSGPADLRFPEARGGAPLVAPGGIRRVVLNPETSGAEAALVAGKAAAAGEAVSGAGPLDEVPWHSSAGSFAIADAEGLSLDDIGFMDGFVDVVPGVPSAGHGFDLDTEPLTLSGVTIGSDGAPWLADGGRGSGSPAAVEPVVRALGDEVPMVPSRFLASGERTGKRRIADGHVGFALALDDPVFAVPLEFDRSAYANVRRFVTGAGLLPPRDLVSVGDLVNYFDYGTDGPSPTSSDPFRTEIEVSDCPWAPDHRLVRVSLKAREVAAEQPPRRCILLVKASDSMREQTRLPMLVRALGGRAGGTGELAVIAYGGGSYFFLEPTPRSETARIVESMTALDASIVGTGGRTFDEAVALGRKLTGGDQTWRVAIASDSIAEFFVDDAGNPEPRIVRPPLDRLAQDSRWPVVVLATGSEVLSDRRIPDVSVGPIRFVHLGSTAEAEREFAEVLDPAPSVPVAEDVSFTIEFNPGTVVAYRALGDSALRRTGEGGEAPLLPPGGIHRRMSPSVDGILMAGREVTALFEIIGVDHTSSADGRATEEPLKYHRFARELAASLREGEGGSDLLNLQVRYRKPGSEAVVVREEAVGLDVKPWDKASKPLRWAAAVAGYGMLLSGQDQSGLLDFDLVLQMAASAGGVDMAAGDPLRREFTELVRMSREAAGAATP